MFRYDKKILKTHVHTVIGQKSLKCHVLKGTMGDSSSFSPSSLRGLPTVGVSPWLQQDSSLTSHTRTMIIPARPLAAITRATSVTTPSKAILSGAAANINSPWADQKQNRYDRAKGSCLVISAFRKCSSSLSLQQAKEQPPCTFVLFLYSHLVWLHFVQHFAKLS